MRLAPVVLLVSSTLAISFLPSIASAQARIFCCDDAQGRKVCSDFLPPECVKRAYEERDSMGFVVSRKEAPLTPAQLAQREEAALKEAELERKKTEERRRNLALLSTYSTESDIDHALNRAVNELQKQVEQAEKQMEVAAKNLAKAEKEKEFYKNKPLPAQVKRQIQTAETDLKAKQETVESHKADIAKTRRKYEDERKKFRELKGIISPGPALTEPLPPLSAEEAAASANPANPATAPKEGGDRAREEPK